MIKESVECYVELVVSSMVGAAMVDNPLGAKMLRVQQCAQVCSETGGNANNVSNACAEGPGMGHTAAFRWQSSAIVRLIMLGCFRAFLGLAFIHAFLQASNDT